MSFRSLLKRVIPNKVGSGILAYGQVRSVVDASTNRATRAGGNQLNARATAAANAAARAFSSPFIPISHSDSLPSTSVFSGRSGATAGGFAAANASRVTLLPNVPRMELINVQDEPSRGCAVQLTAENRGIRLSLVPQLGERKTDPLLDKTPQFDLSRKAATTLTPHDIAAVVAVMEGKLKNGYTMKGDFRTLTFSLDYGDDEGKEGFKSPTFTILGKITRNDNSDSLNVDISVRGWQLTNIKHFFNNGIIEGFGFRQYLNGREDEVVYSGNTPRGIPGNSSTGGGSKGLDKKGGINGNNSRSSYRMSQQQQQQQQQQRQQRSSSFNSSAKSEDDFDVEDNDFGGDKDSSVISGLDSTNSKTYKSTNESQPQRRKNRDNVNNSEESGNGNQNSNTNRIKNNNNNNKYQINRNVNLLRMRRLDVENRISLSEGDGAIQLEQQVVGGGSSTVVYSGPGNSTRFGTSSRRNKIAVTSGENEGNPNKNSDNRNKDNNNNNSFTDVDTSF